MKIAFVTFSMFALLLSPVQARPDFSGEWVLAVTESHLEAAWTRGIQSGVVRIEHHEPVFRFRRTFTIHGRDSVAALEITTDEKPQIKTQGAVSIQSRMYWEGDILVFSQLYSERGSPDATNVVHYQLLDGGRTLRSVERVTGSEPYENVWVFHRR